MSDEIYVDLPSFALTGLFQNGVQYVSIDSLVSWLVSVEDELAKADEAEGAIVSKNVISTLRKMLQHGKGKDLK